MSTENYVTLFDSNFVPAGLCLYRSLKRHASRFRLWVLCMDDLAHQRLTELDLPELRLIRLVDVEDENLKRTRKERTNQEYCWTLTPFAVQFVMTSDPEIHRVTYLDADLYFFGDPAILLDELKKSEADVLITEHAFSPEYEMFLDRGIYCVQFITFLNTQGGRHILKWWADRCLEWCYGRLEDGKFGDQKYLDDWPQRFGKQVHVLEQKHNALGPWNANKFCSTAAKKCVFYHFHGFRIVGPNRVLLFKGYRINSHTLRYYAAYVRAIKAVILEYSENKWTVPALNDTLTLREAFRELVYRLQGRLRYETV